MMGQPEPHSASNVVLCTGYVYIGAQICFHLVFFSPLITTHIPLNVTVIHLGITPCLQTVVTIQCLLH